jgi:hypothetical protein
MTKVYFAAALALSLTACTSGAVDGTSADAEHETATSTSIAEPRDPSSDTRRGQKSGSQTASAAHQAESRSAPVAPQYRDVDVAAGTALALKLSTGVASNTSRTEDPVRATLAKPVVVDGATIVPAGAVVNGSVIEAKEAGRVKGRAAIALRFDRLQVWDDSYPIRTARIAREAEATKGEDATKIGIGAGAGAVIGAVAGGKKGALVGSAVGAGAGTGVVMATRGEEVQLPAGTTLTTTLQEPVTIRVPLE